MITQVGGGGGREGVYGDVLLTSENSYPGGSRISDACNDGVFHECSVSFEVYWGMINV